MAIQSAQMTGNTQDINFPSGKVVAITNILVCNTSGANTGAFDLHFVKAGQAAGVANQVINNLSLPPEETFTFDSERIILDDGDKISLVGSTDLSITVSYMEV